MPRVNRTLMLINPANDERVIVTPDQDAPEWTHGLVADEDWSENWPKPQGATPAASQNSGPFDPADHNLAEVKDYLAGLADDGSGRAERDRVVEAERARGDQARKGIVGD